MDLQTQYLALYLQPTSKTLVDVTKGLITRTVLAHISWEARHQSEGLTYFWGVVRKHWLRKFCTLGLFLTIWFIMATLINQQFSICAIFSQLANFQLQSFGGMLCFPALPFVSRPWQRFHQNSPSFFFCKVAPLVHGLNVKPLLALKVNVRQWRRKSSNSGSVLQQTFISVSALKRSNLGRFILFS